MLYRIDVVKRCDDNTNVIQIESSHALDFSHLTGHDLRVQSIELEQFRTAQKLMERRWKSSLSLDSKIALIYDEMEGVLAMRWDNDIILNPDLMLYTHYSIWDFFRVAHYSYINKVWLK